MTTAAPPRPIAHRLFKENAEPEQYQMLLAVEQDGAQWAWEDEYEIILTLKGETLVRVITEAHDPEVELEDAFWKAHELTPSR